MASTSRIQAAFSSVRRFMLLAPAFAFAMDAAYGQAQAVSDSNLPPVRLVIPFPPGGITDTVGRLLALKLQERWKRIVLIENRPGAGGALGAEYVMHSPPDGNTLLIVINSMLLNSVLDPNIRYDLTRDLDPVTLIGTSQLLLLVSNDMGVRTMPEFAAAMKAKPEKYSYGSVGIGSSLHLNAEQLARALNARPIHVPLKGNAQVVTELIAGRIDFTFSDQITGKQFVDTGKLHALGVNGTQRSPLFPKLPTMAELGYPGFEVTSWYGIYAPRGTPAAKLSQISADFAAVLKMPEVAARVEETGTVVRPTTPEETRKFVANDLQAWTRVIKETNLTPKQAAKD
jgi:tripartite-type tricarboxylate transporter receptor subunit TctC